MECSEYSIFLKNQSIKKALKNFAVKHSQSKIRANQMFKLKTIKITTNKKMVQPKKNTRASSTSRTRANKSCEFFTYFFQSTTACRFFFIQNFNSICTVFSFISADDAIDLLEHQQQIQHEQQEEHHRLLLALEQRFALIEQQQQQQQQAFGAMEQKQQEQHRAVTELVRIYLFDFFICCILFNLKLLIFCALFFQANRQTALVERQLRPPKRSFTRLKVAAAVALLIAIIWGIYSYLKGYDEIYIQHHNGWRF